MRGSKTKKLRKEVEKLGLGAPAVVIKKGRQRLVDVPGSEGLMVDVTPVQVIGGEVRRRYQQLKGRRVT
uniref:Uncharacterized protein n=1 Tax=viral metagenome TaxID=1070528 RepID=A0A6H2A4M6_9ZZZZ